MNAIVLDRPPEPAPFDPGDLAARLFDEIAALTADVEGVSRPAFSRTETETLDYLATFARERGLVADLDAGQNLVVSLPEDATAASYILVGSHVDSVPHGGNFDGLAGVLSGLLCLVQAKQTGRPFAEPVKVIAIRAEESAWFGPCYIGSKALLGVLSETERSARHKKDGRTLDEHMAATGIDMQSVRAGIPLVDRHAVKAYIEVHIEQGPVLIERNLPAAIVSGIRGNFRYKKISCFGEAGHSGAVPLAYRHDPVLAMAELLNVLDAAWHDFVAQGRDLVVTSGMVSTDQQKHALSRIPDSVEFSLDIRSQDADMLQTMDRLIRRHVERIERERAVRFELGEALWTNPALCSKVLTNGLADASVSIGLQPVLIPSGGGHDAAVFAETGIPSGMVFIRNRNGSHNPNEAMEIEDFAIATSVLYQFLLNPPQMQIDTQQTKEAEPMFAGIIDIIRQKGNAVRAYHAAAKAANDAAIAEPQHAAGYFMLGLAAKEFADAYYGEPLQMDVASRQLDKLARYADVLDEAFSQSDAQVKLDALSSIARDLATVGLRS